MQHLLNPFSVTYRMNLLNRISLKLPADHPDLLLPVRISHGELHHKAIHLHPRQWIGTLIQSDFIQINLNKVWHK